jgi:ABC-type cobalamin transport system ATPase subunit
MQNEISYKTLAQIKAETMIDWYKSLNIKDNKLISQLCGVTVNMIMAEHSVNKTFYKKVLVEVDKLLYEGKKK